MNRKHPLHYNGFTIILLLNIFLILTEAEKMNVQFFYVKTINLGFPGGTVVENPPANAGDTGSSPGPGGSHMPRSN